MRRLRVLVGALLGALSLGAAAAPCAPTDAECARDALARHAVRNIAAWRAALQRPAADRVGPAPDALVEYITLDNIANGWKERPRAVDPEPGFLKDVNDAIAGIPPDVWRQFESRLAGIYFVDSLGGTGYTEVVADASGNPAAAFVVLDVGVLRTQRANAWATWKERSVFRPAEGYRLQARIESDGDDTRRNAIQYILLHELGHVLSVGTRMHPPWTSAPASVEAPERYPFFSLSWRVDKPNGRYASRFDDRFEARSRVAYYGGGGLESRDMAAVYSALAGTNFPTLYAATSPGDDFAESFASYVHVVRLKRPWQILINRPGLPPLRFGACWDEPRCAPKRALLERLLSASR